jgi:hypothetical protein
MTGGVTERTETVERQPWRDVTPEERELVFRFIQDVENATDDELQEWAAKGGLRELQAAHRSTEAKS